MFIKPFRIKSNTQIKSTERKKIRNKIESVFKVNEDDLNKLFPAKSTLNQLKLITHSEDHVIVYTCDRRPLFFECPLPGATSEKTVLAPTVYALWILPELVPYFSTHPPVLPRLANGADLMLPGVIRQGSGHSAYGTHRSGAVVAVNLTSNASAIGVGTLAKSSAELSTANNSGICVNMLHVFGDKLWNIEPSVCLQVPDAGAVLKAPTMNDFPTLGESLKSTRDKADASKIPNAVEKVKQETVALETNLENLELTSDENVAVADGQDGLAESNEEADSGQSPDDKLKQAFLTALKKMGKKPPVPLLTSNFYRNHILTVDGSIDIKKTTYKKLSKFLQDMASGNYITVKEEPKGVEKIVAVNSQHPDVVNTILNVDAGGKDDAKGNGADGLFVTEMKEIYTVTADTMKFFNIFDIKRGEAIEPAQVKKYVKDYVCNNKLQDPKNIRSIHVDDVLREMCDIDATVQVVPFEDILMTVMEKMDHNFAMRHRNELKTSGKQSTIKMTLATRCGNKQVTLVDHLEMFGIRLTEFAQTCKIGVASSTSIIRPDCPGNSNKGQIMIQGNQVRFVHKLLTETYKIPPKMITGLELAKKEKKAKKK